jgi:hypothetical protein
MTATTASSGLRFDDRDDGGSRARPLPWGARQVLDAVAAVGFVAAVWALPGRLYDGLVGEDGPLEWLQVLALGVGLVVLVRSGLRAGQLVPRLVLFGLAAVVFVVIGEEIAWGTRLFDVAVSAVQSRNVQGEVTLHNLGGMRGLEKSFLGIAFIGLAFAGWVVRRSPGLAVWFAGPAAYAMVRVLHDGVIDYRFAKLSELVELLLYAGLARVALSASAHRRASVHLQAGMPG